MYVVELQENCWLADVTGDPGRTVLIENAQRFKHKSKAEKALQKAKIDNPFRKFTTAEVVFLK